MEKKELKKVFEMFYRVPSHGESIRGTGLGLYIVASVIKSYGGTVTAASEGLGNGCSITVRLPVTA
jgi:signal transduction histidine kinase